MNRILLTSIAIILFAFNPFRAVCQTSSSNPFFPFIEYSEFEGCEAMKRHASEDDSSGTLKYVFYVHFGPSDEQIASAFILRDQYKIKAVMAPMYCSGNSFDHFYCYNDVVEQLMRHRLMRNFRRLIETKADSLLKAKTPETLRTEYLDATQMNSTKQVRQ